MIHVMPFPGAQAHTWATGRNIHHFNTCCRNEPDVSRKQCSEIRISKIINGQLEPVGNQAAKDQRKGSRGSGATDGMMSYRHVSCQSGNAGTFFFWKTQVAKCTVGISVARSDPKFIHYQTSGTK